MVVFHNNKTEPCTECNEATYGAIVHKIKEGHVPENVMSWVNGFERSELVTILYLLARDIQTAKENAAWVKALENPL